MDLSETEPLATVPVAEAIAGTAKLAEALAKAQGDIKAPAKRRKVDFTNKEGRRVQYNYADLADVIDSYREPLAKNGLAITHRMEGAETGFGMITELLHSSGQKLSTFYPLPHPSNMKPQEFGSAQTYGRRYSVSALLGIASEEDDDGENADPPAKPPPGKKVAPKDAGGPPEAAASKAQIQRIQQISREKSIEPGVFRAYLQRVYRLDPDKPSTMKRHQAEEILQLLEDPSFAGEAALMAAVARADSDSKKQERNAPPSG